MRYIKEILFKNGLLIFIYIAIGILNAFLTNYKADYFQKVIDGLTDDTIALSGIIIYGIILIANYCMNYIDEYPSKKLEQDIYLDFRLISLNKISRIDYLEYQRIGMGKLAQRVENGAQAGKNLLYNFWLCLIRQLIPTIIFSVYFIWRINKKITYAILGGYFVVFVIINLLLKILYQIKEKILINEEKLNHFLVRGFMEMTVFRMERYFRDEIRKASACKKEIVNSKVKMNMIHEAFFTIFALLVAVLNVGVLIYALNSKAISIGSAVALISLIDNAYTPIAIFNVLYVQYRLDKAAFKRFEEFLDLQEDLQLEKGIKISGLDGDIEIKKLSFSYGGRSIFENLNLTIRKGEKVAFVGESGSGKSTLVKLIAGLVKYDTGSIQVGGCELNELCLNSLYNYLSYVSQEFPVFDGTLRENLIFNKQVPEQEQIKALERAGLKQLLEDMPDGLDTEIGERGTVISGGERQRLALARLWFEKKEINILDEATSAMDNLTEESVMAEVIRLLEDRTVIAIAHRLNSVVNFDRIIVFNKGKIVGQGTFEELMQNNEYFIELYNASVK